MVPDVPALAVEALDWLRGEAGPSRLPSNGTLAPPLMSRLSSWPQDLGGGSGALNSQGCLCSRKAEEWTQAPECGLCPIWLRVQGGL